MKPFSVKKILVVIAVFVIAKQHTILPKQYLIMGCIRLLCLLTFEIYLSFIAS
jgi:hypothetical protein